MRPEPLAAGRPRVAAVAVALALLVSGCASTSGQARLQERVNAMVAAANAGDAAGLRTTTGLLLREVDRQEGQADLSSDTAQTLRVLANRILANAGLLEAAAPSAPPAAPSAPPPAPSPTPSPEPSPPAPSPSPSPEPSSPPPAPLPSLSVGPAGSPTPSPTTS